MKAVRSRLARLVFTDGIRRARRSFYSPGLLGLAAWLGLAVADVRAAEDREALTRDDRKIAEAAGPWVYNDLERGRALARESGKPLLVVFRCPP